MESTQTTFMARGMQVIPINSQCWICIIVAMCVLSCGLTGCVRPSVNFWDRTNQTTEKAPSAEPTAKNDGSSKSKLEPQMSQKQTMDSPSGTHVDTEQKQSPKDPNLRNLPLPERVRLEGLALAKGLGHIVRMKMCHVTADDEWWIILYQEGGSMIDLKQFVWNRTSEKLEPFLVIRQIPRAHLDAEVNKKDPERTCRPIEVPK